jgi:hypothetical protein
VKCRSIIRYSEISVFQLLKLISKRQGLFIVNSLFHRPHKKEKPPKCATEVSLGGVLSLTENVFLSKDPHAVLMGSNAGTIDANVPLFTRLAIADGKKYVIFTKAEKIKCFKSICFKRVLNVLLMAYLDFARYHIIDERFAKLFEGGYLGLKVCNDLVDFRGFRC